jgi:hypothetical protein
VPVGRGFAWVVSKALANVKGTRTVAIYTYLGWGVNEIFMAEVEDSL